VGCKPSVSHNAVAFALLVSSSPTTTRPKNRISARIIILTEAAHGFIVSSVAEKSSTSLASRQYHALALSVAGNPICGEPA
jgi:hypothetical protein